MEIFKKYLAANEESADSNAVETIEKLIERLNTSARSEDRRDGMRAIKALSKDYRLEVGTNAIFICAEIIEKDGDDIELASFAVETLYNIMCDSNNERIEPQRLVNIPTDLGSQFTEMFAKDPKNIKHLFNLLDSYDLHLRRSVIRLIALMLSNKPKEMQHYILECPNALQKAIDVLSDAREVVRNEAILAITQLTQNNTTIKNIVAFNNAFSLIIDILISEGGSDGTVIVQDCLKLLKSLLFRHSANQSLFKEGGFIKRFGKFFDFSQTDFEGGWSPQKVLNVCNMLKVLRCLVCPTNKQQMRTICQKEIHDCGLLNKMCCLLLTNGLPTEVLIEVIYTAGEMVRGYTLSQQYLAAFPAPMTPPQPAVNILLMTMFGETQPFSVRIAALYCFQCLLYKNSKGQENIISALRPKPNAHLMESRPGQLIFSGLWSNDPSSSWFATVALSHAINGNVNLKEELLRVQLASSLDSQHTVSLLSQCFNLLGQVVQ
ncbi:Vesicle-mediated ER to Golgi transport protein [Cichlidogyrus casuarinus]|uniref:Vesicle-mediated ER to Golgi transport protein n=1 Tax=Cichlidogyrus casuarinus TaxID=1844966 RepID=A0ABD2PJT9_9PLAT